MQEIGITKSQNPLGRNIVVVLEWILILGAVVGLLFRLYRELFL